MIEAGKLDDYIMDKYGLSHCLPGGNETFYVGYPKDLAPLGRDLIAGKIIFRYKGDDICVLRSHCTDGELASAVGLIFCDECQTYHEKNDNVQYQPRFLQGARYLNLCPDCYAEMVEGGL